MFGMLHAACEGGSRLSSAPWFVGIRRKSTEKKKKSPEQQKKKGLCGLSSCVTPLLVHPEMVPNGLKTNDIQNKWDDMKERQCIL